MIKHYIGNCATFDMVRQLRENVAKLVPYFGYLLQR